MIATISFFIGTLIGAFVISAIAVGGDNEKAHVTEMDADYRASLIMSYLKSDMSEKELKSEIKRIIKY